VKSLGLYIHIPFCGSRCPYCDFAFVVRKTHLAGRYIAAVVRELGTRLAEIDGPPVFGTVYFGGGTPSEISLEHLGQILDEARIRGTITADAEVTAEANPGDREAFGELRGLGVNRLSLGAQALDDGVLKALGRRHRTEDVDAAVAAARSAGFANLSLDLIFGAPSQSLGGWGHTLDRAIRLEPEHLSVYGLTVEPGTAFARRGAKGRLPLPDEDAQAAMYETAIDRLEQAGYRQYEISSFARPGFGSRHNVDCWSGRPYLGVGASAHSFTEGCRSWNLADLGAYMDQVEAGGSAVAGSERLSRDGRLLEQVMLGLRQRSGVSEGLLVSEGIRERLGLLLSRQLLERMDGKVRLTRKGLLVADLVCAQLVGGL